VRKPGRTRDDWRVTSAVATVRMVDMDPELEAFIPLFPPADLTDPVTARKNLAALVVLGRDVGSGGMILT
jgi:hypothetical protein